MRRRRRILSPAISVLLLTLSVCCSAEGPRKSPFWAVVASTTIPGGGQFSCENYARGAVICCAQATLTAMTLYEHVLAEEALRRYKSSGDEKDYNDYSHHFDRRKNLLWWDAGILVLSAADAFVDAHMYNFGKGKGVEVGWIERGGVGLHVRLCF